MLVHPLLHPAFNNPAALETLLTLNPSASACKSMAGVDSKPQIEASFINWASGTLLLYQLLKLSLAAAPWDALPTKPAPKFAALQNPSMTRVSLHKEVGAVHKLHHLLLHGSFNKPSANCVLLMGNLCMRRTPFDLSVAVLTLDSSLIDLPLMGAWLPLPQRQLSKK